MGTNSERRTPPASKREDAGVTDESAAPSLRSRCPVACSLDIVGDRWTLLVVRDLMDGRRRYGDLLRSPERIPTNILAERLKRLEREGLIQRIPYSDHPPRAEYELTAEGRELGQALDALARWGRKHFPGTSGRRGLSQAVD